MFATVRLTFEFGPSNDAEPRVFHLQTPWDAVLCELSCNGFPLEAQRTQEEPTVLASSQIQVLEAELSEVPGDLTLISLPSGSAVNTVAAEFLVALDLLWHRGGLAFRARGGAQNVTFGGRWDLTGLVGAGIGFSRAAADCRLETLEGSRYRWSEPLSLGPDEEAWLDFSLDEKKAASVAVFTPGSEDESRGAAAIAVIAPVRAQLAREPIRLAMLVEARNPQEVLLLRELVDGVSELFRPSDELSFWLVGTDAPRGLVAWTSKETAADEIMGQLLDPSMIGRAPDLWDNLAQLSSGLRGATHLVLATNGARRPAPSPVLGEQPVFVFATGRKPYRGPLEGLAQRSGGALCSGTSEGVEVFVERLKVRLSPPLLSDFKLDGWALEQLLPSGPSQVYSDQPTLVMGQHAGPLPKTVTLSGLSPSRQKLAQRVRVETQPELDLAPLYRDRKARWEGDGDPVTQWVGSGLSACRLGHPAELSAQFVERQESWDSSATNTMSIDLFAPPAISVSFGDSPESLGAPDLSGSDTFEGLPPSSDAEPDLFQADSFFSGPSPNRPLIIFQGEPDSGEAEPDLFEDLSEVHSAPAFEFDDRPFDVPSGPPIIMRSEAADDEPEEGEPSVEASAEPSVEPSAEVSAEPSVEDTFEKRRLVSWRHRSEESGSLLAATAATTSSEQDGQPVAHVPEWLEKFHALEPERAQNWLESCSIDHLGLAASLMDQATSEELLSRLSPLKQRAVRTQMEWGFLLETYEREQADRQLSLSLTQELISH